MYVLRISVFTDWDCIRRNLVNHYFNGEMKKKNQLFSIIYL